ncbi:MAG: UDP-N-acetylmuramoyl-L-alanine--D-glutamate ligase [Candidatus Kapabacteria bacterium]|nr:UDP-N-acetylmuramoyl-L-alanine--D-glutamate ligase [Ignavibacteriota bacterium]MCW5886283.1 UDP-N-acetylmuramoyl-L-alanine--D-glutamate ligase [Candidatus Kapabacteria bacterium]
MNVTVVGSGKSGMSAVRLCKKLGYHVSLSESKASSSCEKEIEELKSLGVHYEFGGNSGMFLKNCTLLITSPGVPPHSTIIKEAENKGIEIISELEFAWRHLKNPVIAITGTNGKTTTTALTAFILNNSGKKAIPCGNIGTPLSDLVGNIDEETILVVEASSYQLDRCIKFKPDVAVILNISPDHLAYHGTMKKYISAKWKISSMLSQKNFLILNKDDETISKNFFQTGAVIEYFSNSPVDRGIYFKGGHLYFKTADKEEVFMEVAGLSLPGTHNVYNSMAAALAARAFEVRNEDIRDSLMKFQGVEHRLEHVRTINGVDFINDSKATNINATWYALSSYSEPIIWIAGGRGDSNNYAELDVLVEKNVKCIVAIGEEADNIFNHFCTMKRCFKEDDLEAAVFRAYEESDYGDKVVFTPACKSFDMFMNFEHRGEVFKKIINSM